MKMLRLQGVWYSLSGEKVNQDFHEKMPMEQSDENLGFFSCVFSEIELINYFGMDMLKECIKRKIKLITFEVKEYTMNSAGYPMVKPEDMKNIKEYPIELLLEKYEV